MSFLDEANRLKLTDFKGPNLLLDEEDISEPEGLAGANIEFLEGQVRTRRGFVEVWNPAAKITSLHNWTTASSNRLLYFSPTTPSVVSRNLATSTDTTLLSGSLGTSPVGMSVAEAGPRAYFSFFNSSGLGTTSAYVYDGSTVTQTFQRSLYTTEVTTGVTEPVAGLCTAGLHYIGFLFTTKHGYTTPPGPISPSTGVLVPLSITSSGSKSIWVTLAPVGTWPSWTYEAQLIMTPVDNPNVYYIISAIQGGSMGIPGGTSVPVTFTISISDDVLREGAEATDYFNLYGQSVGGTVPFNPHVVLGYNNRMVYLTQFTDGRGGISSGAFVSNINEPQWITLASHLIQLPEFRTIVTGFPLGGVLYLLGPSWTYAFSDNTDLPVRWAAPRLVSGRIGSPFPAGVSWDPARGYAWVAAQQGLFYFEGGSFPDLPSSHFQSPDWNRINWAAPADTLEVIEDVANRLVLVRAPLDSATTSTHLLVWDWTKGTRADRIRYCGLWNIASFTPGAMAIVQNATTKVKELWVSSGAAGGGKVLRQRYSPQDTALYNDDSLGIDSFYETGSPVGVLPAPVQHLGAHFRLRGGGFLSPSAFSLDRTRERPLHPIQAGLAPSMLPLRLYDLQSEGVRYRIDNQATADAYFILSAIYHYWKPWMSMR